MAKLADCSDRMRPRKRREGRRDGEGASRPEPAWEAFAAQILAVLAELVAHPEELPDLYAQSAARLEECHARAVARGLLPAAQAEEALAALLARAGREAWAALYAASPERAVRCAGFFGLDEAALAGARQKYLAGQAESEARARAQKRHRITALLMLAPQLERKAALSGGQEEIKALRALAEDLEALGAGEEAEALAGRAALYQEHAPAIRESVFLPLPELEALIAALRDQARVEEERPGPALAASEAASSGAAAELDLRRAVHQARSTALLADPAQAVAGEALAALGPGGSLGTEEGARMLLAAQADNGLPEERRRILSGNQAELLRNLWNSGAAGQRGYVAAQVAAYGSLAPEVERELELWPEDYALLRQMLRAPGVELRA